MTTSTFRSAHVINPAVQTVLGTETTLVNQPIEEMAVGDQHVFYQVRTGLSGEIHRLSATENGPPEVLASLDYLVKELRANDSWVCWIKNVTSIERLPVGASALTRDFTPSFPSDFRPGDPMLEIVQAICRFRNQDVVLTENLMAEATLRFFCQI